MILKTPLSTKGPVLSIVKSALSAFELEYRAYRKAADRFHTKADRRFDTTRSVLLKTEGSDQVGTPPTQSQVQSLEREALSNREAEILKLIAEGNSTNRQRIRWGSPSKLPWDIGQE